MERDSMSHDPIYLVIAAIGLIIMIVGLWIVYTDRKRVRAKKVPDWEKYD
jgi:lipid-A-disaccharide synthase-like uncharacterized protein